MIARHRVKLKRVITTMLFLYSEYIVFFEVSNSVILSKQTIYYTDISSMCCLKEITTYRKGHNYTVWTVITNLY